MPDANSRYKKIPRPESVSQLIRSLESRSLTIIRNGPQNLLIKRGRLSDVVAHMTNIYIFSISDYEEAVADTPEIKAIISMSAWNSYTPEVKMHGKENGVGIFSFREFLGAVNYDGKKFLDYRLPEDR